MCPADWRGHARVAGKQGSMGIYTHICLGTNDLDRSKRFYDAVLAPLGIANLGDFLDQGVAYGHHFAEFVLLRPLDGSPATPANGGTVSFKARGGRPCAHSMQPG
jgi:catechol 2,3-dioxygenase-like lactoylglutathione lyase family enzyme